MIDVVHGYLRRIEPDVHEDRGETPAVHGVIAGPQLDVELIPGPIACVHGSGLG